MSLEFEGRGKNEVGRVKGLSAKFDASLSTGEVVVRVDERYFRPAEVETLLGNPAYARKIRLDATDDITGIC